MSGYFGEAGRPKVGIKVVRLDMQIGVSADQFLDMFP
jgi:hypothetical protein